MKPSQEWQSIHATIAEHLIPPCNLNLYFSAPFIDRFKPERFTFGSFHISTESVFVKDPFCVSEEQTLPFLQSVPNGEYQVAICAVVTEFDCARYASAAVRFTDSDAVRYEEALTGAEDIHDFVPGQHFGFSVSTGFAGIFDEKTAKAAGEFFEKWKAEHPGMDLKSDYFNPLLKENASAHPHLQRERGDWLLWDIPDGGGCVPIFQSGFGNGVYPVYFGYDASDAVCCMVILFIDIEDELGRNEGLTL